MHIGAERGPPGPRFFFANSFLTLVSRPFAEPLHSRLGARFVVSGTLGQKSPENPILGCRAEAIFGDSAMGLEEHRLAPDAHRHSHAFKPSCINRLASMPTDVWAKYACRFNSGWCGNGDEKPFAGTSVQVCEDDPSRRRADDAHGKTIADRLLFR
mgnify:CR=1 FL=1